MPRGPGNSVDLYVRRSSHHRRVIATHPGFVSGQIHRRYNTVLADTLVNMIDIVFPNLKHTLQLFMIPSYSLTATKRQYTASTARLFSIGNMCIGYSMASFLLSSQY